MPEYVGRTVGTSAANAAQTVSTPAPNTGKAQRGVAYDCRLFQQATANSQFTFFQPTVELLLESDDILDVTAPAGGVGITSAIAIYLEEKG